MQKQPNKLVLIILVAVMAFAPLQGVVASMNMMVMQDQNMSQMQHANMNMDQLISAEADKTVDCDHCKQVSCCENSACSNGQCFSGFAMIASSNHQELETAVQSRPIGYQSNIISLLPTNLFRPPRV